MATIDNYNSTCEGDNQFTKAVTKTPVKLDGKTVLITGSAGFIGSNLAERILNDYPDCSVVGLDNMNDYWLFSS